MKIIINRVVIARLLVEYGIVEEKWKEDLQENIEMLHKIFKKLKSYKSWHSKIEEYERVFNEKYENMGLYSNSSDESVNTYRLMVSGSHGERSNHKIIGKKVRIIEVVLVIKERSFMITIGRSAHA